ncbi:endonuclease/exonuclease/phosphatase family protein [Leptospira noguchii]|uniref:endonuclease/exonuclease/phosphatase family protein n=1 Tax=Leptospira noguchii TaxID=28182 RepID=UPI001F051B75|nr:endonuclease/exonuclease/phosphatase family protein [Leptospira noguchii]MCH1912041.1 endonuclease/exonuclease/phosphatase family protein [Leptospira noguchii]MCH1915698.1 endonuclease/exonuclease/phosphatase family protein [Leptospira noguchii]UOG63163.1 endonuclease/exonuclease/phosphatase family protein [Leptospira noguchii]
MGWLKKITAILGILFGSLLILIYVITYHPDQAESAEIVCNENAPILKENSKIKVLVWNVQYLAGKKRIFWYDLPKGDGPDTGPSREEIEETLKKITDYIRSEDPDVILFQELHDGAENTFREDQLERILSKISSAYVCRSEAFYWKSTFVPHPKILGSVGMKLATVSKYKISDGIRHSLPLMPADPISTQFNLKRAILQNDLPIEGGDKFTVLNTHLDAFSQGTDTMHRQVETITGLLKELDLAGHYWVLGGDFNLLPPGFDRKSMHPNGAFFYSDEQEIKPLFDRWNSAVPFKILNGPEKEKYYTYYPNDPAIGKPDRTIDYIFYSSNLKQTGYKVDQKEILWTVSDHFPQIGIYQTTHSE